MQKGRSFLEVKAVCFIFSGTLLGVEKTYIYVHVPGAAAFQLMNMGINPLEIYILLISE